MKYKGFNIEPVYEWDCKPDSNSLSGRWKDIKGKIIYYEILDPMEGGGKFCCENTINECKETIDMVLQKMSMKDNTSKSWAQLEARQ
jgi:hypothetical protein